VSQEQLETIRLGHQAFNRGDLSAAKSDLTDDVLVVAEKLAGRGRESGIEVECRCSPSTGSSRERSRGGDPSRPRGRLSKRLGSTERRG
jgi:hypothetical protein